MPRKTVGALEPEVIDLTEEPDSPSVAHAPPKPQAKARRQRVQPGDGEAGPSSAPAQPSKRKKANKEEAEVKRVDASGRTVRWSAKASIKVQERMARTQPSSGHRLFLIDRTQLVPPGSKGGAAEEFKVLGATGNVYTVTVGRFLGCTCPDAQKGNVCKHQLFVMLRVLRRPGTDPLCWQKALLASEADAVLAGAPRVGDGVLASQAVQDKYEGLTAGGAAAAPSASRPIDAGDECGICQEPLREGATAAAEKTTFCCSCGNNVHAQCMQHWISARRSQGASVTCPYCRSEWKDGRNPVQGGGGGGAYVNLADASAAHRGADTSLQALYGDRAVWLQAAQGQMSRGEAAAIWRSLNG